jgi:tetratricopeptide (TPR) repeat protein
VGERLLGIETEYALFASDARGARTNPAQALDALMRNARRQLPYLSDEISRGLFLQNGARFYIDSGGHPEMTTPECGNPWDVVRYIRAGESILLRLADEKEGTRSTKRVALFRCNVDYSGGHTTWGCHESYLHRIDPKTLPEQIIPHLVSRLVYTGAGGFNNLSPGIEFTLSPRTVHLTAAVSHDSTQNRGIFHSKDEALCGNGYHRLHILCGESVCSEAAAWLRSGTTALVVAMCEAGRHPGAAVALRAPVEAMRRFASDPTCTATAAAVDGRRLSAIDIQRHYLAQAEACAGDGFMPAWAGEVCRRWRAVLDCLAGGWESAAMTLDWAIKRALYEERARRRGLTWKSLGSWTDVVGKLAPAWARATGPDRPMEATAVLAGDSPIAGEVARMTPIIRERGLGWDDLGPFLALRSELFEIDTRFGQLGPEGIFTNLDAAGALTHRVDGVDNIEYAVDHPPDVARARVRGQLVRELSGNGARYCCDWQGVSDCEAGKRLDLSDPFNVAPEWKDWPGGREAIPRRRPFADVDSLADLLSRRRQLRGEMGDFGPDATASETVALDPIDLNQTALELRQRDQLDEAERLLRQAIEIEDARVPADSPKRPHRRNNLAIVLMRAGNFAEARRWNAEAWRLKAGQHDLTSGRILVVRIALEFFEGHRETNLYLGQLKTLLLLDPLECRGNIASTWDIPDVLEMFCAQLDDDAAELLVDAAEALNDRTDLTSLEEIGTWNAVEATALETPWPDD